MSMRRLTQQLQLSVSAEQVLLLHPCYPAMHQTSRSVCAQSSEYLTLSFESKKVVGTFSTLIRLHVQILVCDASNAC